MSIVINNKKMPSQLEISLMRVKHTAHTEFPTKTDKFGYLATKCLMCKSEHITKNFCETCDDYIQQVKPNQTVCTVCNS
jgi:hypothetical protein